MTNFSTAMRMPLWQILSKCVPVAEEECLQFWHVNVGIERSSKTAGRFALLGRVVAAAAHDVEA